MKIKTFVITSLSTERNSPPLEVKVDSIVNSWVEENDVDVKNVNVNVVGDAPVARAYVVISYEGGKTPSKSKKKK